MPWSFGMHSTESSEMDRQNLLLFRFVKTFTSFSTVPISEVTDIVFGKDSPLAKEAKFRKVYIFLTLHFSFVSE